MFFLESRIYPHIQNFPHTYRYNNTFPSEIIKCGKIIWGIIMFNRKMIFWKLCYIKCNLGIIHIVIKVTMFIWEAQVQQLLAMFFPLIMDLQTFESMCISATHNTPKPSVLGTPRQICCAKQHKEKIISNE